MAINVNRNVLDPFYRYKMPRLFAKVEGKGNGIKTVIVNMTEIAKALDRPPAYITKYFGSDLGAQTNFDAKNERYIVNGEHDAGKLQEVLDGFIRKFVLCAACDNPETTLTIRKAVIWSKCKACGHGWMIDPKHKLTTFILKNPPKCDDAERKEGSAGAPGADELDTNNVPSDKDMNGSGSEEVDDDWGDEGADEQKEQISAQIGKLIISKDLEKTVEERLDMLHQYFVKAKKEGTLQDSKSLLNEAERLELKSKATLLLADVLFDTSVLTQIAEHRNLLLRFTIGDSKAQRHLLGGIEQVIVKHYDVLLPRSAHIIKALYDTDVIDEEVLLAWGQNPSKKYVKKKQCEEIIAKAMPVLDWLRNAEEDSEESGEEDGDIEFNDRAVRMGTVDSARGTKGTNASAIPKPDEKLKVQADDGEELDIDDI